MLGYSWGVLVYVYAVPMSMTISAMYMVASLCISELYAHDLPLQLMMYLRMCGVEVHSPCLHFHLCW